MTEQHDTAQNKVIENKDEIEAILRRLITYAWNGLRFLKIKLPVHINSDEVVQAYINDEDLAVISQILKRGVNRYCAANHLDKLFTRINDEPDPETEFERQLFAMKADLLDQAKSEESLKEKLSLIQAVTKLQESTKNRVAIRKVDLQLATALARHLDPTITDEKVIDILQFEKERMGR
jgi:vacuolar-type H+-ATPase subunit E/Vma4